MAGRRGAAAVAVLAVGAALAVGSASSSRKPAGDAASAPLLRHGQIQRNGATVVVDLDDVPLTRAVAFLARATDATVVGSEKLAGAPPATLHATAPHPIAAWQQLLGDTAAYSISCDAAGACQVRIDGRVDTSAIE